MTVEQLNMEVARLKVLLEWAMQPRCDSKGCCHSPNCLKYQHRLDWYVMMREEAEAA